MDGVQNEFGEATKVCAGRGGVDALVAVHVSSLSSL